MPTATTTQAKPVDTASKSTQSDLKSTKPATAAVSPAGSRKRRGFFAWFFGGKSKPTPVRVETAAARSASPLSTKSPNSSAAPEPEPAQVRAPEKRKAPESTVARLEKGYAEVTELVHALRQHIDRQADRSERLLEKMDNLPEALQALPKVNESNQQLLATMNTHLEQQQHQSKRLTDVIEGIMQASKHRDAALEMLRDQMTATQEKDVQLMNGFSTLGQNMSKICDFQQKSASVLDKVMQIGAQAEQRMRDMLEINKRNARTLALSGWALVVVSLAMTGFVAIAATRLASYPSSTQQTPQPATANFNGDATSPVAPGANKQSAVDAKSHDSASAPAAATDNSSTTKVSLDLTPDPSLAADTMPTDAVQQPLSTEELASLVHDAGQFVAELPAWQSVREIVTPQDSSQSSTQAPASTTAQDTQPAEVVPAATTDSATGAEADNNNADTAPSLASGTE